jgi:hypothetical protein
MDEDENEPEGNDPEPPTEYTMKMTHKELKSLRSVWSTGFGSEG